MWQHFSHGRGQAFSKGGGPSTVDARLAGNCGSRSYQQNGGPALGAPGLPPPLSLEE